MDDSEIMVLVDFVDEGRLRQISRDDDEEELAELSGKSRGAIKNSLNVIKWISDKVQAIVSDEAGKSVPDTVELEFGIKVGSKAGVLVAQADAEFHIKAKVIWHKAKKEAAKDE